MSYSTRKNAKGRIVVTSPKGKDWKTTYSSQGAADKAVAYIEGRFGVGPAPASRTSPPSLDDDVEARGRKILAQFDKEAF